MTGNGYKVSEHFLWIGTEAVVRATTNTPEGINISNFIGIKLNTSEETIGKNNFKSGSTCSLGGVF